MFLFDNDYKWIRVGFEHFVELRHALGHVFIAEVVLDEFGSEYRELVRPQDFADQQLADRVLVGGIFAPDARQAREVRLVVPGEPVVLGELEAGDEPLHLGQLLLEHDALLPLGLLDERVGRLGHGGHLLGRLGRLDLLQLLAQHVPLAFVDLDLHVLVLLENAGRAHGQDQRQQQFVARGERGFGPAVHGVAQLLVDGVDFLVRRVEILEHFSVALELLALVAEHLHEVHDRELVHVVHLGQFVEDLLQFGT